MKVTVVCEHNASMDSEEGKKAYPEGMGACIAGFLKQAGYETTLVTLNEKGAEELTDEIIASTDVMFWWGHWHHLAVADEVIAKVADRALRGMGMVFLHSAHDSKMFKKLLGTSCSLKWREDAEQERLWCVDPRIPSRKGWGNSSISRTKRCTGSLSISPRPTSWSTWDGSGAERSCAAAASSSGDGENFSISIPDMKRIPLINCPRCRSCSYRRAIMWRLRGRCLKRSAARI